MYCSEKKIQKGDIINVKSKGIWIPIKIITDEKISDKKVII